MFIGEHKTKGTWDIYVTEISTGSITQLTEEELSGGQIPVRPDWSPDGTKIVFSSFRSGNREIYVMNADGNNETRITDDPEYDGQPVWSPDGTKIAFSSERSGFIL